MIGFHALYQSSDTEKIYADLVVDYELKDWDAIRQEFHAHMKKKYPEKEIEFTIETEFV